MRTTTELQLQLELKLKIMPTDQKTDRQKHVRQLLKAQGDIVLYGSSSCRAAIPAIWMNESPNRLNIFRVA
jgi:hypothetical protein